MFAILTLEREIILVGPDCRVKAEYSQSERAYNVMVGPWLVKQSPGVQDGRARRSAELCVSLIFAAIMDGAPGIDLTVMCSRDTEADDKEVRTEGTER